MQEYVTHTYTLTLTCSDYGTIQEYVKRCVKVHELEELQVTHEDPKMFILDGVRMDDEDSNDHSPALDYIVIDYPYDEIFDNKYFTCKAKLRDICAAFERNRQKHKELGIPHTLGICCHGCPGSGKTSAIKAFCAERSALLGNVPVHIIVVNVSLITNVKVFRELYMADYLNGVYVPHDRRVYVLDEIDCSDWRDIIRSRSRNKGGDISGSSRDDTDSENNGEKPKPKSKPKSKSKSMTRANKRDDHDDSDDDESSGGSPKSLSSSDFPLKQGQILEVWDGVIKRPAGQVTFINTNYFEDIDEAILRPGRIDYVLLFDRLPKRDIADMYRQWFDGDKMPECVYANMRNNAFTQADIGCIFSNPRDVVHRLLCENEQKQHKKEDNTAGAVPPSKRTAELGARSHALEADDILRYEEY